MEPLLKIVTFAAIIPMLADRTVYLTKPDDPQNLFAGVEVVFAGLGGQRKAFPSQTTNRARGRRVFDLGAGRIRMCARL